jgi:hypothetical protein
VREGRVKIKIIIHRKKKKNNKSVTFAERRNIEKQIKKWHTMLYTVKIGIFTRHVLDCTVYAVQYSNSTWCKQALLVVQHTAYLLGKLSYSPKLIIHEKLEKSTKLYRCLAWHEGFDELEELEGLEWKDSLVWSRINSFD